MRKIIIYKKEIHTIYKGASLFNLHREYKVCDSTLEVNWFGTLYFV